eukprot:scaffold48134_cov63-Phaeocystis_antarctica.AAC.4
MGSGDRPLRKQYSHRAHLHPHAGQAAAGSGNDRRAPEEGPTQHEERLNGFDRLPPVGSPIARRLNGCDRRDERKRTTAPAVLAERHCVRLRLPMDSRRYAFEAAPLVGGVEHLAGVERKAGRRAAAQPRDGAEAEKPLHRDGEAPRTVGAATAPPRPRVDCSALKEKSRKRLQPPKRCAGRHCQLL